MDNNTIAAYHITMSKGKILEVKNRKLYHWHIPKCFRHEHIQVGDIVLVRNKSTTKKRVAMVLVMNVFREDIEIAKKRYRPIINMIERAPKKEVKELHEGHYQQSLL